MRKRNNDDSSCSNISKICKRENDADITRMNDDTDAYINQAKENVNDFLRQFIDTVNQTTESTQIRSINTITIRPRDDCQMNDDDDDFETGNFNIQNDDDNYDNDDKSDDDIMTNKLFDIDDVNKQLYRYDDNSDEVSSNIFHRDDIFDSSNIIFDNYGNSIFGIDYNIRFNIANYNSTQIHDNEHSENEMILDI